MVLAVPAKQPPAPTKLFMTHFRQISKLRPLRADRPARLMVTLVMVVENITLRICVSYRQRTLAFLRSSAGNGYNFSKTCKGRRRKLINVGYIRKPPIGGSTEDRFGS